MSRFFSFASAEVLCTECRPKCDENDRDGCLRYLPPAVVRERPEPDHCDACHLPKTAVPQGHWVLLPCVACNRWLCKRCRIDQRIGHCVSCPAQQQATGGHWGISLKIPRGCKSLEEITELLRRADALSDQAGTNCKHSENFFLHPKIDAPGRGEHLAIQYRGAISSSSCSSIRSSISSWDSNEEMETDTESQP